MFLKTISEKITIFLNKYKFYISILFFIVHIFDISSDIFMCIKLYQPGKYQLFLCSFISLLLSLLLTIFYDFIIKFYSLFFGEVVNQLFHLNKNLMLSDLFSAFLSYFLGPLTPYILSKNYNVERLSNRLSIVTAITEDIPQAIIALIILNVYTGWNSELAFLQVLSSLFAGIIKYFLGIYLEVNRQSLSNLDGNNNNQNNRNEETVINSL